VSDTVTFLQSAGRDKVNTYGNYRYDFSLCLLQKLSVDTCFET